MLTEKVEIVEKAEELKTKFKQDDWNSLWMSLEYNLWVENLSDAYFTELFLEGSHH